MKSLREELWFNTKSRRDYINITPQVEDLVSRSGVQEGLCLVNAMHITASVYINDAESGLIQDYDDWLEQLAPHEPISRYRHNNTGEDNGDAHLKRQIMGRQVVVAITDESYYDPKLFGGRSPLDPDALMGITERVLEHRPKGVILDILIHPAAGESPDRVAARRERRRGRRTQRCAVPRILRFESGPVPGGGEGSGEPHSA